MVHTGFAQVIINTFSHFLQRLFLFLVFIKSLIQTGRQEGTIFNAISEWSSITSDGSYKWTTLMGLCYNHQQTIPLHTYTLRFKNANIKRWSSERRSGGYLFLCSVELPSMAGVLVMTSSSMYPYGFKKKNPFRKEKFKAVYFYPVDGEIVIQ